MQVETFIKKFTKERVIFKEGDIGNDMYFIREGKVQIIKEIKGENKILAEFSKGDFFGEMAIFTNKPRTASAVAKTDIVLLKINNDVFEDFLRDNVDIAIRLIKIMAERLRQTDLLLETANIQNNNLRTIKAILELADEHKNSGHTNVFIDPSKLNIRSLLSTDELKIILRDLVIKKLIVVEGKKIKIIDQIKLEKYYQFLTLKDQFSFLNN